MVRWIVLALIALSATQIPELSGMARPIEDLVDGVLQPLRDRVRQRSTTVTVIELRSGAYSWPIDRGTMATFAEAALSKGAIAVGIEVDMSAPTSDVADARLLGLVNREARVVALALPGLGRGHDDPLGYMYQDDASLLGVTCGQEPLPFAIRVALAAGVSESTIRKRCTESALRPFVGGTHGHGPVIPVEALLDGKSGSILSGRVALLGTRDRHTDVRTYSGTHSISFINAGVVDSAMTNAWRMTTPGLPLSIFLTVVLSLWLAARFPHKRVGLYGGSAFLLAGLAALRVWVWFPIFPAALLVAVNIAWANVAARHGARG